MIVCRRKEEFLRLNANSRVDSLAMVFETSFIITGLKRNLCCCFNLQQPSYTTESFLWVPLKTFYKLLPFIHTLCVWLACYSQMKVIFNVRNPSTTYPPWILLMTNLFFVEQDHHTPCRSISCKSTKNIMKEFQRQVMTDCGVSMSGCVWGLV